MKRIRSCTILASLLLTAAASAQVPLRDGRLTTVVLPEVDEAVLLNGENGYFIDVPADAVSLVFKLTTSPPEANIDLFVRFGQDVQEGANGVIIADFRSEGPLGTERITITRDSAPPLTAGRYFVAMSAGFGNPQTFGFLRPTITLSSGAADVVVIAASDFESGMEGWTWNFPAPDPNVPGFTLGAEDSVLEIARDGETTRFLRLTSPADDDALVAPAQFLSKLSVLGPNARMEFDLRFTSSGFPRQEVELRLSGATTVFRWRAGKMPERRFTHYVVPLAEPFFQRIFGQASFQEVMANVSRIEIAADFAIEGGVTGFDNFTLLGKAAVPATPVISTFESSMEGWTRNFPAAPFLISRALGVTSGDLRTTVTRPGAGGNPGGYLQVTDTDDLNQDFLIAPDAFLGDLRSLGPQAAIEFDRRHESPSGAVRPAEVRLIGFGGAYRFNAPPAGRDWTHITAPLDPALWTHIAGSSSFEDTLRAVQRIEVSVDDVARLDEITCFDNFQLVVRQVEAPVLTAAPDRLRFVAVQGDAPPPGLAVDLTANGESVEWVAAPFSDSPWVELAESRGTTPAALVISVNPAGLSLGEHVGGVEVAATGSTQPLRIEVTLNVATRTAPLVNLSGVVNNGDFTSNSLPGGALTGGMYAAIFGQRLADGRLLPSAIPFPTTLGSTSVTMGGLPAPMVFASPTQLVVVVPQALTQTGSNNAVAQAAASAQVVVRRGAEDSPSEPVRLVPVRPVLFSQNQQGTGLGSIQNVLSGGVVQLNNFDNPAQPSQAIQIFATGLGPTESPVPDGVAATGVNRITGEARVSIGGITDEPLFAGLSPGSPHLYQVNAVVPADSPRGCAVPVKVMVDGVESNEVTLAVTEDGEPCR